MNNSKFTNKEILSIIKPAFTLNDSDFVYVEANDSLNTSLVEFSYDDPVELIEVDDNGGLLLVKFSQFFLDGDIPAWSEVYTYTMLIRSIQVEMLLGKIKIEE